MLSQIPPKPSEGSVRNMLRNAGFRCLRPKQKPLLSLENRRKRLKFALAHRGQGFRWDKVIFSDEKIFRVRPGGRVRVWIPANEDRYVARYVVPIVSHPEGVMVWAAMDASGAISLRRCPVKVNAFEYRKILNSALPFIKRGRRCVTICA